MAIQQPLGTDPLNIPDHALSHRVFANDNAAPVESVVVDATGKVTAEGFPIFSSQVTATDTTPNYLQNKLVAGTGITITRENPGGNEDLKIINTFPNPMTTTGDIIYSSDNSGDPARLGIGGINTVLHGGIVPAYSAIVESDISLSNNVINNVSTAKHGFMSQLPGGTTLFYRGDGSFATPSSVTVPNAYISEAFSYTADVAHNIVHNLGTYPLVQVFDSSGNVLIPETINMVDVNTVAITFGISGTYTAILTLGSPQVNTWITTAINYTTDSTTRNVLVSGGGTTMTLNSSVMVPYQQIMFKNISNADITITATSGMIDGQSFPGILPSMGTIQVVFDGTNYYLIV